MKSDIALIVGCYKQSQYLQASLSSAKNQIVPDGATRNRMPSTQVYEHHDVIGIGSAAARNAAIENIDADWIFWLDADDMLPSNFIYEMWYMVKQYDAAFVFSGVQFFEGCRLDRFAGLRLNSPDMLENFVVNANANKVLQTNITLPMTMSGLFTKKMWKEVGKFDASLPYMTDLDFWLRCLYKLHTIGEAMLYTSKTFVMRRNHNKSIQLRDVSNDVNVAKAVAIFEEKHKVTVKTMFLPYLVPVVL